MIDYFAYGSNLHARRLRSRVPGARFVALASLKGYVLRFTRGVVNDGSGKCNVFRTGREYDEVLGVVYTIDPDEKPILDHIEGAGYGYVETQVLMDAAGGEMPAYTYLDPTARKRDFFPPYAWYQRIVLNGACGHGLRDAYVDDLRRVEVIQDLDRERAAREWRFAAG